MAIQLWASKNGVRINGQNYEFTDCDSVTINDPRRVHLTRGANSTNKRGFPYMENAKQATTINFATVALGGELVELLNKCYENRTRIGAYAVDTATGESITTDAAILTHKVQQTTVAEGEETYNYDVELECYDEKTAPKDVA